MDAGDRQPAGLARLDHLVRQRRRRCARPPAAVRHAPLRPQRHADDLGAGEALTELEPGAARTRLYPSGSAAVAGALLSVLEAGDELLMADSAYGPTRALLRRRAQAVRRRPRAITTRWSARGIAGLIGERTRAIVHGKPRLADLRGAGRARHLRGGEGEGDRHPARQYLGDAASLPRASPPGSTSRSSPAPNMSAAMPTSCSARSPPTEAYAERLERTRRVLGQSAGPDDAWLALAGPEDARRPAARHEESGAQGRALAEGAAAGRARAPSGPARLPGP